MSGVWISLGERLSLGGVTWGEGVGNRTYLLIHAGGAFRDVLRPREKPVLIPNRNRSTSSRGFCSV